jgi:hypothetical protein
MDSGALDGNLTSEIKKLSREHLEELARMLMERDVRPQRNVKLVTDCLTGKRFKLKERSLAIEVVDGKRSAVTIPAGATLKVVSGPSNGERTVDVLWESRKVEIFTVDVNMRGTEVTDSATA